MGHWDRKHCTTYVIVTSVLSLSNEPYVPFVQLTHSSESTVDGEGWQSRPWLREASGWTSPSNRNAKVSNGCLTPIGIAHLGNEVETSHSCLPRFGEHGQK